MVMPTASASAAPRDRDGGSTGVGGVGGGDDASEYYVDDVEMMKYYSSNASSPPLELYDDDINDNDDDDGSDHANNDYPPYDIHRHPQHYQHQQHNDNYNMNQSNHQNHHATPHGNMTSILSAAGSHSPQKKTHLLQHNSKSHHHHHAQTTTTTSSSGETTAIAAKRALRVRASKYFHRGGGGGGGSGGGITTTAATAAGTTTASTTAVKYESRMDKKAITAAEEVEYVDEKGNIRIMNHHSSSFSSSSNATTALLSASTATTTTAGAVGAATTTTGAVGATSSTTAKQTAIHENPSISSALSFFPRTASSSSSLLHTTRTTTAHHHHHLPHHSQQEQHSQQQHFQHPQYLQQSEQFPFPSQEDKVEGVEANAADPSLQTYLSPSSSFDNNLCEVQSTATSGYTSGGGSDLEVAARRILRGKKGGNNGRVRHHRRRSGTIMSESEDDDGFNTDDDDNNIGIVNLGDNGDNIMSRKNTNGVGRALPPGWRERIQRKTGVQLRKLPSLPSSSSSSSPPQPLPAPQVGNSLGTFSNNASTTITNAREMVHEGTKFEKNEKNSQLDYSYCYETHDNDDPCNQLGVYGSDGQLAMMKRMKNGDNAYHDDGDDDGENDGMMNEEWQHPPLPQQYYQHQHQHEEEPARRHPPTPSPTESIETTYHLEDLERNGAFPSASPNRNYHYHEQNGGYDGGYSAQPHPSGYWQAEHDYQEQHQNQQQQQRLPILHEHHDHISKRHHNADFSNDDNNYSYDAEEEDEVETDFDQNHYSHNNEEWNPDNLTDTRTYREHEQIQTLGPPTEHDKINDNGRQNGGDNIENKIRNSNVSSNTSSVPVIINEYGFPPIPNNPEGTRFGANYYVKEEGNRMSNNNDSNSQRSRNAVPSSSHQTAERRVHFSSAVMEGGVGAIAAAGERRGEGGGMGSQDVNLDSDGFDDDEYFHRFYSNTYSIEEGPMHEQGKQYRQQQPRRRRRGNDESIRGGIQTSGHWEEIPTSSKVQWASTSSKNEFICTKTEDTDSAWSVPESTSSSLKIPDASSGTTAAEINMFPSWNDDDAAQGVSSTPRLKLQKEISKEKFMVELNSVMNDITQSSRSPRGKSLKTSRSHQQRVNAFYDQWVQESKDAQLSARKKVDYSLSDGDLTDKGYDTGQSAGKGGESTGTTRQKKPGLKLFRGRNRAYNSEGERSDTSVEGSRIKGSLSFNLSPLGVRKENKKVKKKDGLGNKTKSPRRMRIFGHMNHHSTEDSFERDGDKLSTWNAPEREGGTVGSIPISALFSDAGFGQSSVATMCSEVAEHDTEDAATKSEVVATPELDDSLHGLRKPESTTIVSDSIDQEGEQPTIESNLNDSRETHTTPIASNAKAQTRLPANNYKPSGMTAHSKQLLPPSGSKGGKTFTNDRIASQRKPGWTQTVAPPAQTEFDDDGTVSTLGSLVTRDTESRSVPIPKSKACFVSDASTVTELSEIERLRRENDLLREKLENASQLSSKVTSMYAKSLKLENSRLREEFENVSQLSTIAEHQKHRHHKHKKSLDSVHRTTLETLLEKGNGKKTRKSRRSGSLDSPVADFNHLPPVAHLINGVDFDDDSITSSYSLRGSHPQLNHGIRGDGCATPEDMLKKTCTRIATTTRSVASQMKSALAQDPNNALGAAPSSRPLNCFTTCRRDKTNDGTTVYVTQKQFNSARGNLT